MLTGKTVRTRRHDAGVGMQRGPGINGGKPEVLIRRERRRGD